jgi:hypothetical protein
MEYCSFNIEDFVAIDKLYQDNDTFDKFKKQDFLLIQEWKDPEGQNFIENLNENDNNRSYDYTYEDRVAVIYDTNTFELSYSEAIELAYEEPTTFEKIYTTGRQKKNILVILKPIKSVSSELTICIVNFHLSAYKPASHPGFHKRQLSNLLKDALAIIEQQGLTNYAVIIGGDTNYRNLGETSNNLLEELIDNIEIPSGGILRDVCETTCLNIKTQSFSCTHEKGFAKSLARNVSKQFITKDPNSSPTKNYPSNSLDDNRLDFIATNLETNFDNTTVQKLCSASDHSVIFAKSEFQIDNIQRDNIISRNAITEYDIDKTDLPVNKKQGGIGKTKKINKTRKIRLQKTSKISKQNKTRIKTKNKKQNKNKKQKTKNKK